MSKPFVIFLLFLTSTVYILQPLVKGNCFPVDSTCHCTPTTPLLSSTLTSSRQNLNVVGTDFATLNRCCLSSPYA